MGIRGAGRTAEMDPKDIYAAAGYKGLDITLPAVETFVKSLASGHTPDELHALYPAPTEQVTVIGC